MRRLALVLCLDLVLTAAALAQQPPPPAAGSQGTQADVSELVNALLGGLMGGTAVDGPSLQKEVEEAGGIAFRRDVPVDFLNRDQLAAYLRELFDEEYPKEQALTDERLLRAFDLLPAGTDLRALRARVLEDNVAGFYDDRPGRRRLYAVSEDRSFTPMNQIVLAHELRHALQDQYADLHALVADERSDFDDRRLAVLSLFEGDATLLMERFVRKRLGALAAGLGGGDPAAGPADEAEDASPESFMPGLFDLPGAPPVVRDQLVQPYLAGLVFARALWKRGGADSLREAWQRPPASTEQVLHPQLFFSGKSPRRVTPGLAAPAGARLASEGVLGELLLRTLLGPGHDQDAAGWGGDGWRLWEVRGKSALAWRSEWDTGKDATEFHQALRARFAQRFGTGREREGWEVFAATSGPAFAVRREGEAVELASADDAPLLDELLRPAHHAGGWPWWPSLDFGGGRATVPGTGLDAEATPVREASGDPAQGGVMATSTPQGNQTNLGMAPNMAGLLCYVPCCIGFIFSVVVAIVEKQSRFVRFHAFQSLLLHGAAIVCGIALQVVNMVLAVAGLGIVSLLISLLGLALGLGLLAVSVFLMIKANGNEMFKVPVVGDWAEKQANG